MALVLTSPPKGSRAARTRATEDRILSVALESFGLKGFDSVSLDDLAADLGITKQAILYHWSSKRALLDAVIDRARAALADGDARWVAEVLNHVVFAEPANRDARLVQAAALEQLGYRSESGVWRAFYLTGAQELRNGTPTGAGRGIVNTDMVAAMTPSMVFTWLGVHVVGPDAVAVGDLAITIDLTGDSAGEAAMWEIGLSNGAFYATPGRPSRSPVAMVRCTRHALTDLILAIGTSAVDDLLTSDAFDISGDPTGVRTLVGTLAPTNLWFPLIEPHGT